MTTLFVAAGGGGDAVGILLARQVLEPDAAGPALITTCAWERLRVDPAPGPRPITGFTGLGKVNGLAVEILAGSDTTPTGRSMLPRLSVEADARIFLHDFDGGATGLANHLRSLADTLHADHIVVVDVGGDIVATGDEKDLLSPLADSLTLAAALLNEIPTTLAVIGPGTDAELGEHEVVARLSTLGASITGHVDTDDVREHQPILDWHPTEASALVAASATGERGHVEMRRGTIPTPLTEHGREVWRLATPRLDGFPLAHTLAQSTNLDEAVSIIERVSINEIAYERAKAEEPHSSWQSSKSLQQIAREAMGRGATHITTRRLFELTNRHPASVERTIDQLKSSGPRPGSPWELESLLWL